MSPVVATGFCYTTAAGAPVQCLKCSCAGEMGARAVRSKDATPIQYVGKGIDHMGHTRIVLKSDSEPAMKALAGRVNDARRRPTVIEDTQSTNRNPTDWRNCADSEWDVKDTQESSGNRIGGPVSDDRPILTWPVCRAACLLNRSMVGHDGGTLWACMAGKGVGPAVAEFGDAVMFIPTRWAEA